MTVRKLSCLVAVWCLALISVALAQKYGPDPDAGAKMRAATQPLTLVARIGYSPKHGGYYVENNPQRQSGNKVILNQNYRVLKSLHRKRLPVIIHGRIEPTNFSAPHIVIDRINGKPYRGAHPPLAPLQ